MPNYSDGKIYKLVDNTTDEVYIGSTTQPLYKRKWGHETSYKRYLNGKTNFVTSFNLIKNQDYRIVLIENYPCLDKSQLHERERYWIKQSNCVNKVIPKRTRKEYREDNKELIKENFKQYFKQYYEKNKESIKQNVAHYWENNKESIKQYKAQYSKNNKESIKQYQKQYQEANKDKLKQRKKQYREANKAEINAKKALKITCDCLAVISCGEKSRHKKSIKHQNYLKSLEPPTQ
jgi:molecular chaperone DnaK (HSP70)